MTVSFAVQAIKQWWGVTENP